MSECILPTARTTLGAVRKSAFGAGRSCCGCACPWDPLPTRVAYQVTGFNQICALEPTIDPGIYNSYKVNSVNYTVEPTYTPQWLSTSYCYGHQEEKAPGSASYSGYSGPDCAGAAAFTVTSISWISAISGVYDIERIDSSGNVTQVASGLCTSLFVVRVLAGYSDLNVQAVFVGHSSANIGAGVTVIQNQLSDDDCVLLYTDTLKSQLYPPYYVHCFKHARKAELGQCGSYPSACSLNDSAVNFRSNYAAYGGSLTLTPTVP